MYVCYYAIGGIILYPPPFQLSISISMCLHISMYLSVYLYISILLYSYTWEVTNSPLLGIRHICVSSLFSILFIFLSVYVCMYLSFFLSIYLSIFSFSYSLHSFSPLNIFLLPLITNNIIILLLLHYL